MSAVSACIWVLILASPSVAQQLDLQSGRSMAGGLNKAWEQLFLGANAKGGGSIFAILSRNLYSIGILGLAAQASFIFVKSNDDGFKEWAQNYIAEYVIPVVLIVSLMANDGLGAGTAMYAFKNITFGIDKVVYESFNSTARTLKEQPEIEGEKEELTKIQDIYNSCLTIPRALNGQKNPVFIECMAAMKSQIQESIASGKIKDTSTQARLTNALTKFDGGDLIKGGVQLLGSIAKMASGADLITGGIKLFMEGLGILYLWCVDMTFMIIGLSLPLVLMFSLYKVDVFLKWAPQVINLFVAKLSYTISVGIISILQATTGLDFGVWGLTLALGLGAPLVSIVVTLALSGSVGSLFERQAMRGLGSAAKTAGKVGGAIIQAAAKGGGTALAGPAGGAAAGAGAKALSSSTMKTIDVVARRV
jgi:hypothetical protein